MYKKKVHIHFVGIGGIGMSGIATILKSQGYEISGCDTDLDQQSIKNLQALGCKIYKGNNSTACNDPSIDTLVYSSAIKSDNPEIVAAQARSIPTIPRALMLAELMRTKYSIAIAGTHGKTTTTSLVSHILIEAALDPTIIIGGHLKSISNNARFGEGDFLVAEADESDRSLTHLHATLAIVTNIDLEHLETYRDLDDIKNTFKQFLSHLPFYGKAIVCIDDPNVRSLLPLSHIKTLKYGLSDDADIYATDITLAPTYSSFTIRDKKCEQPLGTVWFSMPGKHNIQNALAAITLSLELGISFETIAQALQSFKGVERRFSYRGTYKGAELFDDYGHHPTEIFNSLQIARNRSRGKVTAIFQPHRYTRTKGLWNDFISIFKKSDIDHLVITDIYPASESPVEGITGENFAKALILAQTPYPVTYVPLDANFAQILKYLNTTCEKDDLIILQGAGNIYKLAQHLPPQDL